jgi:hypothetical protein
VKRQLLFFRRIEEKLLFRLGFFSRFSDGLRKKSFSVCFPALIFPTDRGKIFVPSVLTLYFARRIAEKFSFRLF